MKVKNTDYNLEDILTFLENDNTAESIQSTNMRYLYATSLSDAIKNIKSLIDVQKNNSKFNEMTPANPKLKEECLNAARKIKERITDECRDKFGLPFTGEIHNRIFATGNVKEVVGTYILLFGNTDKAYNALAFNKKFLACRDNDFRNKVIEMLGNISKADVKELENESELEL